MPKLLDVRASLFGLLAAGALSVACEELPVRNCGPGQVYLDGACAVPPAIRVNSIGYLPGRAKVASYVGEATAFQVKTLDGDVVFEGTASEEIRTRDTGERVRHADFSEVDEPGEYYVEVPGVGRSPDFRIGQDVFDEPLVATLLGLHGQRCGTAVEFEWNDATYSHGVCHEEEAGLDFVPGESGTKDARGGWHDAGDYGRYTVNGAFAVAFVLKAFEDYPDRLKDLELPIPERGGDLPDVLDEARYQLEWLLKMQLSDGSASHKVTAQRFEGTVLPENDTSPLYFVSPGTAATANFAAALALAARVYEPYDAEFAERCLTAAQQAFDFLLAHRDPITPDQSKFSTGGYERLGYDDERAWAAAEIFRTTGDEAALEEFELLFAELGFTMKRNFDWDDATNLALVTYLFTDREGRDEATVESIRNMALNVGDGLVEDSLVHGYGRSLSTLYYWGINGVLARTAFNLAAAYRLEPDPKYLNALTAQVDHLLGRNPYGRSYLTGVGHRPARFPHHRPSMAGGVAWPGLLVGGPHATPNNEGRDPVPEGLTWEDASDNYWHNEVAINWNTALVYALAASE